MKKTAILALLIINLFVLSGCSTSWGVKPTTAPKTVTLKYWRAWDDTDAFGDIIKKYNQIHPNIKIEYRKFRYEEYEQQLLEAFAEDRGPDIFSVHNTWVKKYQTKILPMPDSVSMTYYVEQGTIKKEIVPEKRTEKTLSVKTLQNNFIDQVYRDAVINVKDAKTGKNKEWVFGLPLYVDTLAMYYNKDLFNNAGIAEISTSWNKKFLQDVKKLTKQDSKGQIIQSGVALGGFANIDRATDILSVLMMQNGTMMMDGRNVAFNVTPPGEDTKNYNPGLEALRFYTDFANPSKEVYCWNKNLNNSLKMFEENQLAIMFGYSYDLPIIRAEQPKLNFAVTKLPQIENSSVPVNFANYWLETVAKKTKYSNEAWDFVQFATKAEQAEIYLSKTKKPTALKSLIEKQSEDPDIGVFAQQLLTAKSWYQGDGAIEAEKIMGEMIDAVVAGLAEPEELITIAAKKVSQTVEKNY